jgi:hypothetical protein
MEAGNFKFLRFRQEVNVVHTKVVVLSNANKILIGKPERKRPLGRPKRRCENNIGMDLSQVMVGRCGLGVSCFG